jgi:PKD repeat protein
MRRFSSLPVILIFALSCVQINAQVVDDTCSAGFAKVVAASSPLLIYYRALAWHNNNKKPEQICWSFGDGQDTCVKYDPSLSNNYALSHRYRDTGTFNVCVEILYQGDCLSSKCEDVKVDTTDSCHANFATLASPSAPFGKYFIAQPFNSRHKKPVKICWNFGDHNDTCINYSTTYTGTYGAFHLYSDSGIYKVCAKITYDGGCESDYCSSVFVTTPMPDSCSAGFAKVVAASSPLLIYYRALAWHNNNKKPEQICWSFGDGQDTCIKYDPLTSNTYALSHRYGHRGIYNVCVRILYQGDCLSYNCEDVKVDGTDSCHTSFETLTSTNDPHREYFIAHPWHSNDKKPTLICWNFGDNSDTCIQYSATYTGAYAAFHLYPHAGEYNVCVKISYDGGCESHYCKYVQMGEPDSCRVEFETGVTSATPLDRHFTALPFNNHEKKPSKICWVFGDGRDTCVSYSENYTGTYATGHHYANAGIYDVCLKINYYGGCEVEKCKTVNITDNIDTCAVYIFEITSSSVSLTRSFYFSNLNNNKPNHICWNFGDGTDTCLRIEPNATEIPFTIKHTYTAPGVYRTCIKVLFANGCSASDCHEVTIRTLSDVCGGYYLDSLVNLNTFVFKGLSIHKPDDAVISYRWTFGDGSSDAGEQVTHTYAVAGDNRVCLLINTKKGCETRICNDVKIAGADQTVLHLSPNPVSNVLHASFYSAENETVTIRIINSNGVVVKTYTRAAVAESNTWEFATGGLLPGAYSFVVQSPNQFASDIFFKL